MLHISEEQVRRHLPMGKAIELLDGAFRDLAAGTAINHPRRRVVLPNGSILHYMPAGNSRYFGIKVYSSNPKTGAHFTFLLYRSEDGMPLANIEADALGQIRTGAASGLATRLLARQDASVVGIIGSGYQAEAQLRAISSVRKLSEVRVWSRNSARREEFARKFEFPARAASSAEEAVRDAGIIVTATSSKEPVIEEEWISPGTHINAMGSNWANRRELPASAIQNAGLIVVDAKDAARLESGDLLLAGVGEERWVELNDLVTERHPGRSSDRQITVFKSHGLAIEDVVAAGYVYEQVAG